MTIDGTTYRRKNAEGITYEGRHYTGYEATQVQRQIERSIRKTKRELIGFDKAGLKGDFMTSSIKLRRQREYYDDFSKKAELLKQNERAQVSGYGRSLSGKVLWVEEKELERYSRYHYNRDGTIVVTGDWKSKNHPSMPSKYKSYAVIETKSEYADGRVQINRSFYDGLARLNTQVH